MYAFTSSDVGLQLGAEAGSLGRPDHSRGDGWEHGDEVLIPGSHSGADCLLHKCIRSGHGEVSGCGESNRTSAVVGGNRTSVHLCKRSNASRVGNAAAPRKVERDHIY
jgi:hypothetical protein